MTRWSYYRSVLSAAWRETRRVTVARLAVTAAVVVLTPLFTWLFRGDGAIDALLVGIATLVILTLAVFMAAVIRIPADLALEREEELRTARLFVDNSRKDVEFHQQRTALRNLLTSLLNEATAVAERFTLDVINARERDQAVDASPIFAAALDIARRAQAEAMRLGYQREAAQIGTTVDTEPVSADEALASLADLRRTIQAQLASGFY